MSGTFLDKLIQRYYAYVDTFRDAKSELPVLLRLKLDHSARVAVEARDVIRGERWTKSVRHLGEAAALLHDTARYLQFHAFGTFRDSDSFDHADHAVDIIRQQGWLDNLSAEEQPLILTAVRLHNKREVPPSLTEGEANLVHVVRDADKLDIFQILEKAVSNGSLASNPEIAWNLPMAGAPNPEVVEAVSNGQTVSYDAVRSLTDFILIQVGWLNGGLHFKTSMQLAVERKTLEFRETFLKTLTDDHASISRCCDAVRNFWESTLENDEGNDAGE